MHYTVEEFYGKITSSSSDEDKDVNIEGFHSLQLMPSSSSSCAEDSIKKMKSALQSNDMML